PTVKSVYNLGELNPRGIPTNGVIKIRFNGAIQLKALKDGEWEATLCDKSPATLRVLVPSAGRAYIEQVLLSDAEWKSYREAKTEWGDGRDRKYNTGQGQTVTITKGPMPKFPHNYERYVYATAVGQSGPNVR